jgi:hypothetical protein
MATAKQKVTKKKVWKTQEVKTFILSLSEQEAVALRTVLRQVGGDPLHSLRKEIDCINEALDTARIGYYGPGVFDTNSAIVSNTIIFKTFDI